MPSVYLIYFVYLSILYVEVACLYFSSKNIYWVIMQMSYDWVEGILPLLALSFSL